MFKKILVFIGVFFAVWAHADTPLVITKGDNVPLLFTATTDGTTAMDLTGATLEAKITDARRVTRTYSNSSFNVTNQALGQFTFLLSPSDTVLLASGSANIAVRVTQSGLPLTIHADNALLVVGYP